MIVELFSDLDLYQSEFHTRLVESTKKFWTQEIWDHRITTAEGLKEYLVKVKTEIIFEKERINKFLDEMS